MSKSHLYPGFRYAGRLGSVALQRQLQRRVIDQALRNGRDLSLLSIGCAFGDELASILSTSARTALGRVATLDLAPVADAVYRQEFVKELGSRFQWMQCDLLDLDDMPYGAEFDLLQCGFVLHDVAYESKDKAISILARALRPGGQLIVSDIFVSSALDVRDEVSEIYDAFIREAEEARSMGFLGCEEWQLLVGDGLNPGLHRSKRESICEQRDFFDTLSNFVGRAARAGLELRSIETNPLNQRLQILLMQRPLSIRIRSDAAEGERVL